MNNNDNLQNSNNMNGVNLGPDVLGNTPVFPNGQNLGSVEPPQVPLTNPSVTQTVVGQDLGSIEPPTPSVQQVPMTDFNGSTSVNLQPEGVVPAVPTNTVETTPTIEPLMGTNLGPDTNLNMNQNIPMGQPQGVSDGMSNVPQNNIGMLGGVPVPPAPEPPVEEKKKKPKMNKTFIFLLVVVLIAAIGVGVYYFLNTSKKKTGVTITPIVTDVLELGMDLPEDPRYYVNVSGMNAKECSLESNVNTSIAGSYEWSVTCGSESTGKKTVMVRDTQPPVVTVKDVVVVPDSEVTADQFIDTAIDASEVTYKFEDGSEFDTSVEGTYEVNIVASDAYGNENVVTANLTVDSNAPVYYLSCEYEDISAKYPEASITVKYKYGINSFQNVYSRKELIEYFFDDDSFEEAVMDVKENEFDGWIGKVTTNSSAETILIEIDLTVDDLNKEFGVTTNPSTESEIKSLHEQRNDYCITLNY